MPLDDIGLKKFVFRNYRNSDEVKILQLSVTTTLEDLPQDYVLDESKARYALIQWFQELRTKLKKQWILVVEEKEENGNQFAGYLWVGSRYDPITQSDRAWLYEIALLPSYRGVGLGKEMLKRAENWSTQNGFQDLGLNVFHKNQTAREFYEKLGFKPLSHIYQKNLL